MRSGLYQETCPVPLHLQQQRAGHVLRVQRSSLYKESTIKIVIKKIINIFRIKIYVISGEDVYEIESRRL